MKRISKEQYEELKIDYLCNLLRKAGTHESLVMPNAILLLQSCKKNNKKVTDIPLNEGVYLSPPRTERNAGFWW